MQRLQRFPVEQLPACAIGETRTSRSRLILQDPVFGGKACPSELQQWKKCDWNAEICASACWMSPAQNTQSTSATQDVVRPFLRLSNGSIVGQPSLEEENTGSLFFVSDSSSGETSLFFQMSSTRPVIVDVALVHSTAELQTQLQDEQSGTVQCISEVNENSGSPSPCSRWRTFLFEKDRNGKGSIIMGKFSNSTCVRITIAEGFQSMDFMSYTGGGSIIGTRPERGRMSSEGIEVCLRTGCQRASERRCMPSCRGG